MISRLGLLLAAAAACGCLAVADEPSGPAEDAPYLNVSFTLGGGALLSASSGPAWRSVFATAAATDLSFVLVSSIDLDGTVTPVEWDDAMNSDSGVRRMLRQLTATPQLTISTCIYYSGLNGTAAEDVDADALTTDVTTALKDPASWAPFVTAVAADASWTGLFVADFVAAVTAAETAGTLVTAGPPEAPKRPPYTPFGSWAASDVGGFIGTGIVLLAIALMYVPNKLQSMRDAKAEAARVAAAGGAKSAA